MQTLTHPVSGTAIQGVRLVPGATIKEGDRYDSMSGGWDELGWAVGQVIQPGCETIWVRQPGPLSDNACTLLGYLNLQPWGEKTCVGERNGSFFVIPSPTFNWDGRFDIYSKQVAHPECVQELVDHGYLVFGEHAIHRSESHYAACELYGTNRAYTLTDEGKQKEKDIISQ